MRTHGTPSEATITNKTRPAGSFSSRYSQAGCLAGPVFYAIHCKKWLFQKNVNMTNKDGETTYLLFQQISQ
jgi:hypothetical protein